MVDMAKLVDAADCGSAVRDHMRVRLPLFTLELHWQNGIAAVLKTDGSFAGEKVRLLYAALMPVWSNSISVPR